MFAGGRRRSSNVRAMQLFHELKQQFPTVPDNVVQACIAKHAHTNSPNEVCTIREVLEAAAALNSQELMGHTPSEPLEPSQSTLDQHTQKTAQDYPDKATITERNRVEMNESESDFNRNVVKPSAFYCKKHDAVSVNACEQKIAETSVGNSSFFAKRPNHLDIKPEGEIVSSRKDIFKISDENDNIKRFSNIQPSERCKDVHKLLNSDNVSEKPPRSPLSAKRFANISAKNSPTKSDHVPSVRSPLASPEAIRRLQKSPEVEPAPSKKRETVETPTQTTDTLLGANSVNLSLNVNCSMDVVQSPTRPRRSSVLNVTPQQPWLEEPISPRSYTSVNLTLRPPSSEPQAPIDITSQNSSLTYSTSMFDSQKGLQSRLQITVGPTGGSVSSVRTRPRSSYHPQGSPCQQDVVPARAGSLPDLAANSSPPVIIKQQARLERLRIELRTEKTKLIAVQEEVAELENSQCSILIQKTDVELEKQLQKEIRHLRFQCERLTQDIDRQFESTASLRVTNEEFYRNIYTGQRGPLNLGRSVRSRLQYQGPTSLPQPETEGPKWNCHMCTFQNHPALSKCEQCDMPRILHGRKMEPPNPNIAFSMIRPVGQNGPYTPNHIFNNNQRECNQIRSMMRPNAVTNCFSYPNIRNYTNQTLHNDQMDSMLQDNIYGINRSISANANLNPNENYNHAANSGPVSHF